MHGWNQLLKRSLLAALAVVVAFAWSSTGRAQSSAPCLVGRGQDPLDVLNSGIRHNVWVILDTSGSMNDPPASGGGSKIQIAKDALNRLMDDLVDGAGRPLVNWAFVNYDNNRGGGTRCPAVPPDANGDTYPDSPTACLGLKDTSFVQPGTCSSDSRADVRTKLDAIAGGSGQTPIGTSFTQIASYITGDGLTASNTTSFVANLLPNQKNYIIHLTDGEDTCECNAGGYPGMIGDPLESPVNMRPSQADPDTLVATTDAGSIASYNAGLKGEFALKRIDPQLDGSKGNIFVIGFDITPGSARDRLNTIAWMASGAHLFPQRARNLMNSAFFASGADLVDTFRDILARIGIPQTEVTLGAPIVASVREVIDTHTDTSVARSEVFPSSLSAAEDVRQARIVRADHRDNVLFTTSVEVPSFRGHLRATNLYTVTDAREPRTAREEDLTEIWDAGVELQDDDPDARQLFFNRRGSTALLPFDRSNVTAADLGVSAGFLGARTDSDARDIVVQVVRGYRLVRDPGTGTYYDINGDLNFTDLGPDGEPTWKLFESTAGAVAVVGNPPRSPDLDPPLNHGDEYGSGGTVAGDGFYWDQFNRRTLVFYPSNLGILHAFDGETGAERFGYIPDDALGLAPNEVPGSRDTLKDYVVNIVTENNAVLNHRFTLSSPPNPGDAFLRSDHGGDDDWHTLLAFGRGIGGRFLTVLDVTNAATDPSLLRLRWNRGNREGIVEGPIDGLGETWSIPVFGNVDTRGAPSTSDTRVDQWLVFAGGGYGCDNGDDEGQHLFAFRAEDGFLYRRASITSDPAAAVAYNGLPATPTVFSPHTEDLSDGRDFVTRVYIPDLHGRVWKLDTSDIDPAAWTMNIFAEMGPEHPITAAINVLNDPFEPNRVLVLAGSGGDRRAPVPPEGFKLSAWIDQDADGSNTTQYLAGSTPAFERIFNTDERMFTQAVTFGRLGDPSGTLPVVFFAASREDFDVDSCSVTFSSTLYARTVNGGQPDFDLDSTQAGEDVTDLGQTKVQGLFARDNALYVSESGGLGDSGKVGIWGSSTAFQDEPPPAGAGRFTLQLLVEGFRISPF